MSLEIEGKLHKVFPIENKSGNFQAREFVVEVERLQIEQQTNVDAINKAYNVYEAALSHVQGTKTTGR